MASNHETQKSRDLARTISFGLAAAGIATIIQLATLSSLDIPLSVAVCASAVSIPALVTSGLSVHSAVGINLESPRTRLLLIVLHFTGILAAAIAFGGLFFHFGKYYGLLYSVMTVICLFASRNMETMS